MVDYVPTEKGTTIRYPSTALLCIDTADRVNPYVGTPFAGASSPFDCQFIQKQNILNGFFTRFSTTEITLEWAEPNIELAVGNDRIQANVEVPITGSAVSNGTTVVITTNNYFKVGNFVELSGLTGGGAVLNGTLSAITSLTGSNPSTAFTLTIVKPVVSGTFGGVANGYIPAILGDGFYNVADALDAIVCDFNNNSGASGATPIWEVNVDCGSVSIYNNKNNFTLEATGNSQLVYQLGLEESGLIEDSQYQHVIYPDLRLFRFLDFTCPQLTYAQDVKDATTNPVNVDSLARFYMAYDEAPQTDKYGFPILLGYKPTTIRRAFNPPKQIKWENGLPVGNLNFKVYGSYVFSSSGEVVVGWDANKPTPTNWLMTIQVSEV
jgi:hypothetical protein